jgi:nucleotide-binding universal stress UspA family protein
MKGGRAGDVAVTRCSVRPGILTGSEAYNRRNHYQRGYIVLKTILLASDFTAITERAEAYAVGVARAMGARITLLHSIEPVDDASDDIRGFLEGRKAVAERKAEAVAERLRAQGVDCDVRVEIGKRWKAIVDVATAGGYDLVVVGSHKAQDGDKLYVSTTAHKVFLAASVPLMVVPNR